jgi:ATPase subunit of ABC transporter with duplicated ATPase domains
MSATLHARGVSFAHGPNLVLEDIDLTVAPGMRVGVLGPNGAGKSTLLGVLSGRLRPESGEVSLLPPIAAIGELRQESESRTGESVEEFLARRTGIADVQVELDAATDALAAGREGADDRYSDALERWLALGAADFEIRAAEVVDALGLTPAMLAAEMTTLSGGETARAGLAAVLLSRFDVLLLDEPTNDLDFDGLDQIERFVLDFAGPVVVVSHDRAFLDRVVTHVAELDEHSHRLSMFAGGWSAFLHERDVARRHAEEEFRQYDSQRADLKSRAQREREWSHRGVKKEKRNASDSDKVGRKFRKEQTEQLASRARRTERAIDRLESVDKPWESWDLQFTIAVAPRAGAVVARLDGAVVERPGFTLGPVSLEVGWGERIGIVGHNGAGKTTLLAALLGRIPLDAGVRWQGPGVVIGEIDQARDTFSGDETLLGAFLTASGVPVGEARGVLAKFGLGPDHVLRPASSLSPGERTRAGLALLQSAGVNTLVLDEPTNHLDLPAIEQLESALGAFPGTVLLVTHDRRLLETVPLTRIVRVEEGMVTEEDRIGQESGGGLSGSI